MILKNTKKIGGREIIGLKESYLFRRALLKDDKIRKLYCP